MSGKRARSGASTTCASVGENAAVYVEVSTPFTTMLGRLRIPKLARSRTSPSSIVFTEFRAAFI